MEEFIAAIMGESMAKVLMLVGLTITAAILVAKAIWWAWLGWALP